VTTGARTAGLLPFQIGVRQRAILTALLLLLGALLFVERAGQNADRVNLRMSRTDQGAYINYARKLKDSDYSYVGPRNRMPVYPLLLAAFMRPGEDPAEFFARAKHLNIWLSLAAMAVIASIFLTRFPRHAALNLTFIAGFTVFLFKAPNVQAEIPYYTLTFLVFLLFWRAFAKPGWIVAIAAGALLGLAHLTKASVLPGLFAFAVFYALDALWRTARTSGIGDSGRDLAKRMGVIALVLAAFVSVIFPYISKSKEIYGHYLYNVNSTFYFWCDSWDEATGKTKMAGDREGWPKMDPAEIPSPAKYLREHTVGQILMRPIEGIVKTVSRMFHSYGYFGFLCAYSGLALWLVWARRRLAMRLFLRRPMPYLALAAYFCGYALLVAWYSRVIPENRFILGLFLPYLYTLAVIIGVLGRVLDIRWKRRTIPLLPAFQTVISIWLAGQIAFICLYSITRQFGGS